LVKSHTLNIETVTDTTDLFRFLNGVPYIVYYDEIRIADNRLLKYNGIPVHSLAIFPGNDKISEISLTLFKETEKQDAARLKEILVESYGKPQEADYGKNVLYWKAADKTCKLEIAEEGYPDNTRLTVRLGNNTLY